MGTRQKIVTFEPADNSFDTAWQSAYGITKHDGAGKIEVRAPGNEVVKVSQEILTKGAVVDITIEDVPLEDVIADLFEKH